MDTSKLDYSPQQVEFNKKGAKMPVYLVNIKVIIAFSNNWRFIET